MITQDLGIATAYGYAKSKGYTGTEAEFAELMASYASTAQTAIEAADRAVEANTAAQSAKTDAAASKTAAQTAAQTATTKASEASQSASTATTKASEASTSAGTASTAAQTATDKASIATTAAAMATTKASEAEASATTASTAKTDAETARDAAAQSASEAAASAESIDPDEFNRKIYAAYVTDTASGAIASFADGADSIPMKDVLVHIEPVQAGSGDPSPENVRPITGWTGVKVTRAGRNMLPPAVAFTETNNGVTLTSDGRGNYTVIGATGDNSASFTFDLTGTLPWNGTEYVHLRNTVVSSNLTFSLVDKDRSTSYWGFAPINRIINLSDVTWAKKGQVINKLNVYVTKNTTVNFTISPSVELSGDATDYEPYTGYDTYDITFPTEAGTVYGGTLDVTSGVLTVDRAQIASYNGEALPSTWISDRDVYASGTTPTIGAQVVYKLATPITYTLTPQEITSLLGANNLWADTGNSEVEYRADTKMYIARQIADAVSALS